jgi:hypothetical protein
MRNAKRGRGKRHGVYVGAVAALGFALSGCGGGSTSGSSPAAAAAQGSATTESSAPGQSAADGSGASAGSTSASSTESADSVTINWIPPTENTNGSPLTNLAGYNIHYGTSSASLTKTISISNPGIATYVVGNLTPGRYYFAVAAVNSAGTESPLSTPVSATVTN